MTPFKKKGKVFIGTSGYNYKHWSDGVFYPKDLSQREWLEHYTKFFKTVELNVTFYRLLQEKVFEGWKKRTPGDFSFAVKGSRFITHVKRLKDIEEPLKNFFKRASLLRKKLSVVLWQLPPNFKIDTKRLASFLNNLKKYKNVRNAFEFRHPSWLNNEIFEKLDKMKCSICLADWPEFEEKIPALGNFVYLRRHGVGGELYGGCYSNAQLKEDACLIKDWAKQGKDVYIYFNNDSQGWAVQNAFTLQKILKSARKSPHSKS